MNDRVTALFGQLRDWKTAVANYAALAEVRTKELTVRGNTFRVQFNPARLASSTASVDAESIRERPCFLCPANLPPEQEGIPFGTEYTILVNPFPIFPRHLTIPSVIHTPQRIAGRMPDMLDLAAALGDYVLFYNGPRCGASAPDHVHFQAGNKGFLPFETGWKKNSALICEAKDGRISKITDNLRSGWILEGNEKAGVCALFEGVCKLLEELPAEDEPMMNLLAWHEGRTWTVVVFPREKHRPACFFADGGEQLTVSPASVDLGGVFITPREEDFEKITPEAIAGILNEVCLNKTETERINNRIKELL